MANRRDFLKMFSVASAVVATPSATPAGTTFDVLKTETPEPILRGPSAFNLDRHPQQMYDVQKGRLYSAVDLPAGAEFGSHLCFFGYECGSRAPLELNGRGATLADTNLYRAFQLYEPEAFLIEQIGVIFSPATDLKTYRTIVENCSLSVWLGQKMYQRSPIAFMSKLNLDRESVASAQGLLDLLPYPLVIQAGLQFHARPEGETIKLRGRLRMWTVYEGRHARGVQ